VPRNSAVEHRLDDDGDESMKQAYVSIAVDIAVFVIGCLCSNVAYRRGYQTVLDQEKARLNITLDELAQIHAGNTRGAIRLAEEARFRQSSQFLEVGGYHIIPTPTLAPLCGDSRVAGTRTAPATRNAPRRKFASEICRRSDDDESVKRGVAPQRWGRRILVSDIVGLRPENNEGRRLTDRSSLSYRRDKSCVTSWCV
jgi:hypothetical protein